MENGQLDKGSNPIGQGQAPLQSNNACGAPMPSLFTYVTNMINRYSRENESNTPDFILGEYLLNCLQAFEQATKQREKWYGVAHSPGGNR